MITQRDAQMMHFIGQFKAAHTSTIQELFYPSYRVTAYRLKTAIDAGELKRDRDGWSGEYLYYIKKPKQLRHALLLTDFYRELHKAAKIIKFIPEPQIGNVRPDAVAGFSIDGYNRLAFIEVEISHKGFNAEKYERLNWQQHFPVRPEIIAITNAEASVPGYKVMSVNTEFSNFKL